MHNKFWKQKISVSFIFWNNLLFCYLTTAMHYSYVERPSPSVDGWFMVWMIYNGHMITGDECDPNFLTFVLWLSEKPGKNLNLVFYPTGDRTRARCVRSNDVTSRLQWWFFWNEKKILIFSKFQSIVVRIIWLVY